jgi:hypothetical protein
VQHFGDVIEHSAISAKMTHLCICKRAKNRWIEFYFILKIQNLGRREIFHKEFMLNETENCHNKQLKHSYFFMAV